MQRYVLFGFLIVMMYVIQLNILKGNITTVLSILSALVLAQAMLLVEIDFSRILYYKNKRAGGRNLPKPQDLTTTSAPAQPPTEGQTFQLEEDTNKEGREFTQEILKQMSKEKKYV